MQLQITLQLITTLLSITSFLCTKKFIKLDLVYLARVKLGSQLSHDGFRENRNSCNIQVNTSYQL